MADDKVRLERSYEAAIEDVWDLWTTKEGFESWWGPEGFRVHVHELEAREGGALLYDMIAVGESEVAFMKSAGRPISHETRGTFVEVTLHQRLRITHLIDFLEGVEPYENSVLVELAVDGKRVTMAITVDAHRAEEMTRMSQMGWTSQLTKVPAVLAARARARAAALVSATG